MWKKCKALYRLYRRRLRSTWRKIREGFSMSPIKAVFHWKYSGVLIFFFYALAFAMIGIGTAVEPFQELFNFAYVSLFLAAFWAVGWWLTSDVLERKKPKLTKKQKKHSEKVSLVAYRAWQWIPMFLIVLALLYSLKLASRIELARELNLNHGLLVSANEPTPPNPCQPAPKNALVIILGNKAVFSTGFPAKIIAINNDVILTLDKDSKGSISITTDIYDQNDDFVVGIEKNKFTPVSDALIERNDLSSLKVTLKHRKEQVLDVRYINPSTIRVFGIFRHPDDPELRVTTDGFIFNGQHVLVDNVCIGDFGILFQFNGKASK